MGRLAAEAGRGDIASRRSGARASRLLCARSRVSRGGCWLDDLTAAAMLGSAMTAMLIGHSYLIAPAMSLTPLYRLLGALAVSTVAAHLRRRVRAVAVDWRLRAALR